MKKLFSLLCVTMLAMTAWGATVTDVITADDLAATNTTYVDFSGVKKNTAVYAGNSAKNSNGAIQMRSKNSNSGIVSTTSGGKLVSVKITVESGTNVIDVYGSNTAYTAASNLYSGAGNNQGTKLGSTAETATITVNGDYEYVGIRSNSGAIYISSIEITWEEGDTPVETVAAPVFTPNGGEFTGSQAVTVSCATENASIYLFKVLDDGTEEYVNQFFPQNGVVSGEFYVTESAKYGAYAYKSTDYSETTYATFTKVEPTEPYTVGGVATFVAETDQDPNVELRKEADQTIVKDDVTMNFHGTVYNFYTIVDGDTTGVTYTYRIYKNQSVKFTSAAGNIRKIEFNCEEGNPVSGFADVTGLNKETATWEGKATEVTFTASNKQVRAYSITVTLDNEEPVTPPVVAPVIDPANNTKFIGSQKVTITCETEGATIYYTTDSVYQVYEAPFTITETSTVKAYAELNGAQSSTVTAKYYKLAEVSTLAEANALNNNSDFIFYGNAVVTYRNGSYTYVKDETGYGLIFGNQVDAAITEGMTLSEDWTANFYLFSGMPEYRYPSNVTASTNALVEINPIEYTVEQIDSTKMHQRVMLKGVTLTKEGDNLYLNGLQLYNQFGIELPADVEGNTYNLEAMVSYHKALQLYPIAITEAAAPAGLRGDINDDQAVTIDDVTAMIDYLLSGNATGLNLSNGDCDLNGEIAIDDVTTLIDYLLSGNWAN